MYLLLLLCVTSLYASDATPAPTTPTNTPRASTATTTPPTTVVEEESPAKLIAEGLAGTIGDIAANLSDDGKITADEIAHDALMGVNDKKSGPNKLARGCFLLCCARKK